MEISMLRFVFLIEILFLDLYETGGREWRESLVFRPIGHISRINRPDCLARIGRENKMTVDKNQ